jgi:Skp family chaperone for outer membrane proteins
MSTWKFTPVVLSLAALLLASSLPASAQTRGQFPIVYVSIQRILTESEDAKAAAKEIDELRTARQKELAAKKQALDATKLEAANSGGWFSRSRLAELTERAKAQEADLQLATQQAQTDLQDAQKKMQERLRADVNGVLTKLATERGVAYVLNQDTAIVLAPAAANLTDEVLTRMNAAFAARTPAPANAPAAKTP